ncbi:MAG TPA: Rieske (2Fe-2S) protein [Frankiaceae bacterium]|jgi:nitrite reductase/ring-hydroxylating ferredoxin subunit
MTSRIASQDLPHGSVTGVDGWAVGRQESGELFAVGRRCRHQRADLGRGSLDADGCLVCPWHGSRYDTTTGAMVDGPRGSLFVHLRIPLYSGAVKLFSKVLPLRSGRARRQGDAIVID